MESWKRRRDIFGNEPSVVATREYIALLTATVQDSREIFDRSGREIQKSLGKYAQVCSFLGPCTLFEALWNQLEANGP